MIKQIVLKKTFFDYLIKRRLLMQYSKAEEAILSGKLKQIDFKIRQPKSKGIYYFRINKQYRVI
jgi:plasmid maintenance system killer protein